VGPIVRIASGSVVGWIQSARGVNSKVCLRGRLQQFRPTSALFPVQESYPYRDPALAALVMPGWIIRGQGGVRWHAVSGRSQ